MGLFRDDRFDGDDLPDGTWGYCKVHGPDPVRLVDERGEPAIAGLCERCHEEALSDDFFTCPIHGINPRSPEKPGCPVDGCLGESAGPTAEEIEREAEQIRRLWQSGDAAQQDAVDAQAAGPAHVGGGASGRRVERETRAPIRDDSRGDGGGRSGAGSEPPFTHPFLLVDEAEWEKPSGRHPYLVGIDEAEVEP